MKSVGVQFLILTTVRREKLDFSETQYQSKVISGLVDLIYHSIDRWERKQEKI